MASPLTLSEVRSMLPAGLSAQPAERSEQAVLRALLPSSVSGIRLLVGSCSCDLVRARHAEPREDERHLRTRYREEGAHRDAVIRALDRHRRGADARGRPGRWAEALSGLVAEHARNAGETLYLLTFGSTAPTLGPVDPARMVVRTVAEVRSRPGDWLEEDRPTLVR